MSDYGVLSILPPALSIFLAILTRNIMLSLTVGAFSGAMILADFNPFFAMAELVEEYIFIQIFTCLKNPVVQVRSRQWWQNSFQVLPVRSSRPGALV